MWCIATSQFSNKHYSSWTMTFFEPKCNFTFLLALLCAIQDILPWSLPTPRTSMCTRTTLLHPWVRHQLYIAWVHTPAASSWCKESHPLLLQNTDTPRITEYDDSNAELKGTYMDHRVQLLLLHRTSQASICPRALSKRFPNPVRLVLWPLP